jgi:hypothetical protein
LRGTTFCPTCGIDLDAIPVQLLRQPISLTPIWFRLPFYRKASGPYSSTFDIVLTNARPMAHGVLTMVEIHPPRRQIYGRDHAGTRIPDDRERRAEARRGAEALFAPKPSLSAEPATSSVEAPRVLTATPAPEQSRGDKSFDRSGGDAVGERYSGCACPTHSHLGEVRHDDCASYGGVRCRRRGGCEAPRQSATLSDPSLAGPSRAIAARAALKELNSFLESRPSAGAGRVSIRALPMR